MVREYNSSHECLASVPTSRAVSRLRELVGVLSEQFRLDKSVLLSRMPQFDGCCCVMVRSLKQFCGGLLEGDPHPWREVIRGCSSISRFRIAASLFLFRKVLPSPDVDLHEYVRRMSTPQDSPDPSFLKYVEKKIEKMFPYGWDRHYARSCDSSILPPSSCVERGRGDGGVRELIASGEGWYNIDTYEEIVKYAKTGRLSLGPSKVVSVETGGKKRIVSTPCANMNFLRPLHHTLYDRISRSSWLLRGDANPSRFKDFTSVEGEVFCSGDYESATDNLNIELQKFILRKVLENACHVPSGIKELAIASQQIDLDLKGKISRQQRGQLMGNLLSFPLLCLVNYLGFKFAVRRNVPLRVNGDDIVFRASPLEVERWMKVVGKAGLTLSKGKTLVHRKFFSLNSTFFCSGSSVKRVPVIRSKPLFGMVEEGVVSFRDRFFEFARGWGRGRDQLNQSFLRLNKRFILASGRSVRNGLGVPVSSDDLRKTGLLRRESRYLSSVGSYQSELSVDEVVRQSNPYKVEGWSLVTENPSEELKEYQYEHSRLLRREIWTQSRGTDPPSDKDLRKSLIKETGNYDIWSCDLKFMRMLKLSRRSFNRFVFSIRPLPSIPTKIKVDKWWVPDTRPLRQMSSRTINFVSGGRNATVFPKTVISSSSFERTINLPSL